MHDTCENDLQSWKGEWGETGDFSEGWASCLGSLGGCLGLWESLSGYFNMKSLRGFPLEPCLSPFPLSWCGGSAGTPRKIPYILLHVFKIPSFTSLRGWFTPMWPNWEKISSISLKIWPNSGGPWNLIESGLTLKPNLQVSSNGPRGSLSKKPSSSSSSSSSSWVIASKKGSLKDQSTYFTAGVVEMESNKNLSLLSPKTPISHWQW